MYIAIIVNLMEQAKFTNAHHRVVHSLTELQNQLDMQFHESTKLTNGHYIFLSEPKL